MGIGGGERPEAVERRFKIAPQPERVETLIEPLEFGALLCGEDAGGPEALIGRIRAVVDAVGAGGRARRRA